MSIKQDLIANCDKGIKRNRWAMRFNALMVGANFLFCFMRYKEESYGLLAMHFSFLLLHWFLGWQAVKLIEKWKKLKEGIINDLP